MNANCRQPPKLFCEALIAVALLAMPAAAQRGGMIGKTLLASGANSNASLTGTVVLDDEPEPPADVPVIYLQDNDWLAGAPVETARAEQFGWRSPAFTLPFEFDLRAVTRVRFPAQAQPAWREHDYRLELAGGDVLYGELLSVGEDHLVLRSSQAGELRVKRSAVRCLERCRANALVYLGPNGLDEWHVLPDAGDWHEDNGDLVTTKDTASLYGKIDLPARALIEFEVSSLFPPVFKLSLGTSDEPSGRRRGFRLEVVDFDVIAIYETENDIDVARIMTLAPGPDRDQVRLRVLLDQEAQRADVFSIEGTLLASVQADADAPHVLPGILLEHKRGGLRLERLRVWRWTGSLPQPVASNRSQLNKLDGSIVHGKLARYDAERRQFVIATEQGEELCAEEQAARIYFDTPADGPPRPMRARCADGTQLSGWFAGIEGERMLLDCPSLDTAALDSIGLPLEGIASLVFGYEDAAERRSADRDCVVRLDGGRLHGDFEPAKTEPRSLALAWLPRDSVRSSPLRSGVSARIAARQMKAVERVSGQGGREQTSSSHLDTIYLTTGDIFRCQVSRIDELIVSCQTASAEKRIAHRYVKAIELAGPRQSANSRLTFEDFAPRVIDAPPASGSADAAREKIARLLTLPRLQRDDPPWQILCATSGDYLRGRLQGMSDDSLRFIVAERERQFPRARIAAIVWLHPEPPEQGGGASNEALAADEAHVVCIDGTRITFGIEEMDESLLIGTSKVLGECRLPLDKIAELYIGDHVRLATTKLAYHSWKLTPAPDPKAFQSSGESGSPADSGKDSSLVGHPAPDFQLDLVDGSKFRLSDEKGRTVVLDFWASWCAPCVRGLPKLAQTVAGQEAAGIKLVTVNLQQSPDEVQAALARMKLDVAAALDRDGAVAARYGATAIPYTVIVAADGNIARVFLGGGTEIEKQFEAALKEMVPNAAVGVPAQTP
jgi:peroxiredoxin